ncbi:DUF2569 family protein [Bartonella sp. HY329]|uniref:DUF2569 family protein n=1 Tax=unclassified Bartonella TaxID=2645622 RepID=UPI0021C7F6CD|nr:MULTISPECIES: DUF2569 family protein [unclassified Bartonella]UXM95384.1 DUF2569 family protein [Bartonella sp. HY329]UXN09709.1 DUF2569 family protein [Bartonella sp. HY328]
MKALTGFKSTNKSTIGGLLYIVAIYLTYLVVGEVFNILRDILYISDIDRAFQFLKSVFKAPFFFEKILLTIAFIGLIKERRYFPSFFSAFLIYKICHHIIWALQVTYILKYGYSDVNTTIPYTYWLWTALDIIFLIYITLSKRVKNTFIN